MDVIAAYGNQDLAIGNALRFFRFAQELHKKGDLISEEEFERKGFNEALFPIFAERVEGGIRARGSSKHFSWLMDKAEAGSAGGKVSASRPRDSKGRLLGSDAEKPKQDPSTVQAEPGNLELLDEKPKHPSTAKPLPLSLPLSKKEDLTLITRSVEEGGESQKPTAISRQRFRIHSDLQDSGFNDVLSTISEDTQSRWLRIYKDPTWIRTTIAEAISFYTARGDDLADGWGILIHRALQRADRARRQSTAGVLTGDDRVKAEFWAKVFAVEKVGGGK